IGAAGFGPSDARVVSDRYSEAKRDGQRTHAANVLCIPRGIAVTAIVRVVAVTASSGLVPSEGLVRFHLFHGGVASVADFCRYHRRIFAITITNYWHSCQELENTA